MNSYMITAKIYEFVHNMNSYLYEFIYLKCKKYMNSYTGHPKLHMKIQFLAIKIGSMEIRYYMAARMESG
jgi:hypothetical protein